MSYELLNPVIQFVKEYYINNYQNYLTYREYNEYQIEESIRPIFHSYIDSYISLSKIKILDLACGNGEFLVNVRPKMYLGLDISYSLLKNHKLIGNKNSYLINSRIEDLSFCKFKNDLTIVILGLNYIKNFHNIISTIKNISKNIFICLPNPDFDREYGLIENGIVNLIINNQKFVYYHHDTNIITKLLDKGSNLQIEYSKCNRLFKLPTYCCIYGEL